MNSNVFFSAHALVRCAQRNITKEDVKLAIQHGRLLINAGTYIFFLGKRDIVRAGLPPCYNRLEGLTVHAYKEKDGSLWVITAYRNRKDGLKRNRRKSKHNFRCRDAA